LRKNPVERYQTLMELRGDLARVAKGKDVEPYYVSRKTQTISPSGSKNKETIADLNAPEAEKDADKEAKESGSFKSRPFDWRIAAAGALALAFGVLAAIGLASQKSPVPVPAAPPASMVLAPIPTVNETIKAAEPTEPVLRDQKPTPP